MRKVSKTAVPTKPANDEFQENVRNYQALLELIVERSKHANNDELKELGQMEFYEKVSDNLKKAGALCAMNQEAMNKLPLSATVFSRPPTPTNNMASTVKQADQRDKENEMKNLSNNQQLINPFLAGMQDQGAGGMPMNYQAMTGGQGFASGLGMPQTPHHVMFAPQMQNQSMYGWPQPIPMQATLPMQASSPMPGIQGPGIMYDQWGRAYMISQSMPQQVPPMAASTERKQTLPKTRRVQNQANSSVPIMNPLQKEPPQKAAVYPFARYPRGPESPTISPQGQQSNESISNVSLPTDSEWDEQSDEENHHQRKQKRNEGNAFKTMMKFVEHKEKREKIIQPFSGEPEDFPRFKKIYEKFVHNEEAFDVTEKCVKLEALMPTV